MNPNNLAAMLASGDTEQIKNAQRQLQALGYDIGASGADGGLGPATSAAMAKYRQDYSRQSEIARDTAVAQNEARDPGRNALNMAIEVGPYAAGAGAGAAAGHFGSKRFNAKDAAEADAVKRIAANPEYSADVSTKKLRDLNRRRLGRNTAQFLGPAAAFGSAEAIRHYVAPNFDKETQKYINLAANLDQGIGFGLGLHQLVDLKNRIGAPWDPEDEVAIKSRGAPKALREIAKEPASAPKPGTRPALFAEARARGLPVTTRTKKADIEKLLADAMKKGKRKRAARSAKMIGPLAAGAIAYDAATSQAEAAGMNGTDQTASAIGAAGAAGGATYGMQRLMDALGRYAPGVMRAAGGAAQAAMPQLAADMTDYSPQDRNAGRNWLARNLPESLQFGAVDQARQMAQVPEGNPARLEDLVAAAERDPVLAQTLKEAIQERLAGPHYP